VLGRRGDARARRDLNPDVAQSHFSAGEGAQQHQLVQVAQMADAEQLPRQASEPSAQRQVVAAERHVDHVRGILAFGHHDGAHRVRVPLGRFGAQLQAPGAHRRTHALGETGMAREDRFETLFQDDRERLAQAIQHRNRRRVGEVSRRVRLDHVAEIEEHARAAGLFSGSERLGAGAHDPEARRQHQAFLRAGHGEIHLPLVHPEIDRSDGADAVDVQQRGVLGGVDGAAHRSQVARHAGGGFVVHDQHALDLVLTVLGQDRLDAVDRRALAPLHVDDIHPHAVSLRQVDPQVAELSVAGREHSVAGRQRVDEGCFPPAGAGRGKKKRLARGGPEHLLQVAEQAGRQVGERRRAVILHGAVHRAQDPVGHVGRSRDEEKITAGHSVVLDERGKGKRG
jgi:hypothetical protein